MSIVEEFKAAFSERFEVDRYTVQIGPKLSSEWGGQSVDAKAAIVCEGQGQAVTDAKGRPDSLIELVMLFVDDDPKRYKASVNREKRTATVYFRFQEMPIVLDVLRNEKPIFGYVNERYPEATRLSTAVEPIGEGEK